MTKRIQFDLVVGNDNGNSEHDIIINGELIRQPNCIARPDTLPNLEEINIDYVVENIESNLITTITSSTLRPGIYYVGDYARSSRERIENIKVGVENSKLNSDIPVASTLSQIGGYAVKKAYEKDQSLNYEITVNVDMVTALPVTQYNKANSTAFANKFMEDKHTVIVHVGTKRVEVKILFNYVKVLPESTPIVFFLQSLNQEAISQLVDGREKESKLKMMEEMFKEFNETYEVNIDGTYFKDKKIQHCGIGEGTTEYPQTSDISFNPQFIEGSDNGVGHAIEEAITPFKKELMLRNFERQNYSAILKDEFHKYYEDAKHFIKEPLKFEARDILNHIKAEIEKANNDVDIIAVHGGGSILMKEHLYESIKKHGDATRIKVFYAPKKYAVCLEVLGMYEFAKSPIFEALKLRYQEVASTK